MRLVAWGDALNNSGGLATVQRFKLKLGATTLFDTGVGSSPQWANTATRFPWKVVATIMGAGATNAQTCLFEVWFGGAQLNSSGGTGAFTTGSGSYTFQFGAGGAGQLPIVGGGMAVNTSAVDMTSSQALVFSVINGSANASYETVLKNALVVIE